MSQLTTSLEEAHLVPGAAAALIPASFAPSADLSVSFGDAPVQLGNLLRVSQVQQKPTISFQIEVCTRTLYSSSPRQRRSGLICTRVHRPTPAPLPATAHIS